MKTEKRQRFTSPVFFTPQKLTAVLVLILALPIASVFSQESNLIKNPGFEEEKSGAWKEVNWAKNEVECKLDGNNPHSGKWCQRISLVKFIENEAMKKHGKTGLQFLQAVVAKPGTGLELRFWMRGGGNSRPVNVQLIKQTAPFTKYFEKDAPITESWTEQVIIIPVPPTAKSDDLNLVFILKEENTIWIDDVNLKQLPPQDPQPPLTGNQLLNGSFEVGLDQWTGDFRAYKENADAEENNIGAQLKVVNASKAPHGAKALSVPVREGSAVFVDSGYFPLRYGHPASLGLWVKSPAGGKKFTVRIHHGNFSSLAMDTQLDCISKSAEWEYFSTPFTPSISATKTYHFEFFCVDPGEYLIDAVTVGEGDLKPMPNPINVGSTPIDPHPANLYFKDAEVRFSIEVEASPELKEIPIRARIVDAWERQVKTMTLSVPVNSSGTGTAIATLPSDKFGGFKCEIYSSLNRSVLPDCEIIYSIVPNLKSPAESQDKFFGAHVMLTPHNLEAAKLMGVRSIRLHPPHFTKWKLIDRFGYKTAGVQRATTMGFNILGLFDTVPPKYADAPEDVPPEKHNSYWASYGPKNASEWRNYVKSTYENFGKYIKEWEVWNEPDGGFLLLKPDQNRVSVYTNIVHQTRLALEEAQAADVNLVGGAVARTARGFLDDCLEAGMNNDVDSVSFHFYHEDLSPDEAPKPVTAIERSMKFQKLQGRSGKPLEVWETEGNMWITDAASWYRTMRIPTASSLTMLDAAHTLSRTIIVLKANGIKRYFHYHDYVQPNGHRVNRSECASTFDVTGVANPAVTAYATCVRFLEEAQGQGIEQKFAGHTTASLAHFTKGKKSVDVIWSRIPVKLGEVEKLPLAGKKGYDMMGNPVNLAKDTEVTLAPIYLVEE